MFGFIIFIHVVACIFLILIILMQSGRGGGLTEGFAPAESLFGAKTNVVLVKATAIMATVFIVACLLLAFFSTTRNRSLMEQVPAPSAASDQDTTVDLNQVNQEIPAPPAETEQKPAEQTQQSGQEPDAQNQPADSGQNANP